MPTDADGDGYTPCDGDCDDNDPTTYPGGTEICGDAADNDCDGATDPEMPCQGKGTFVAESGDDGNPGTKAEPVRTILQGITNALDIGNGADVYVAEGAYQEDVALVENVSVLGGYEAQEWTRDPAAYTSEIQCAGYACVHAGPTITRATRIDGFTISGRDGAPPAQPGGVAVNLNAGSPTVSNNRIFAGDVSGGLRKSVGVYIKGPPNESPGPLLEGNEITGGQSASDASTGILIDTAAVAEIIDNVIRGGAGVNSYGIEATAPAQGTKVADNDIRAGSATSGVAFGIATRGDIEITANRINTDLASPPTCQSNTSLCGGIASYSAKAIVTNNVVFGAAADQSVAIYIAEEGSTAQVLHVNSNYLDALGKSPPGLRSTAIVLGSPFAGPSDTLVGFIRNNILVAGRNTSRFGVYEEGLLGETCSPVAFTNNLLFFPPQAGTTDVVYRDWAANMSSLILSVANLPAGYTANLAGDPMIDATFHLMTGSPCINAGTAEGAPSVDFEGHARPLGTTHDIGPDEAM
jgi:hypothetical protein